MLTSTTIDPPKKLDPTTNLIIDTPWYRLFFEQRERERERGKTKEKKKKRLAVTGSAGCAISRGWVRCRSLVGEMPMELRFSHVYNVTFVERRGDRNLASLVRFEISQLFFNSSTRPPGCFAISGEARCCSFDCSLERWDWFRFIPICERFFGAPLEISCVKFGFLRGCVEEREWERGMILKRD